MKATDRFIVLGLVVVALVAGFWFMVISPKRAEVSDLDTKIAAAETAASEQEQLLASANEAKDDYGSDYHQLVVLGKAVPADSDQASLVEQLSQLARQSNVDFRGLTLAAGEGGDAAAVATTPTEPAVPAPESGESATPTSVPATEAAVANLPLGATVGPAGLPVMPYDLTFTGGFFEIADFMESVDAMVHVDRKGVGIDSRLLTVDGFSINLPQQEETSGAGAATNSGLIANFRVTSFVAPADQGLTGGASPAAPAPVSTTPTAPLSTPPVAASSPTP